ncbi:putative colanic acid biosynthesis acetyltransferase [Aliagarivorans taiwanensis]|uniref:putative colanic acid biosynthesis acetyltransferase n=1 Tax=Aliagarivorans taiwanensis TaxID=561966 RepID=UPI00054DE26C|nr:putative colanic acid biosynthesis acetyltransferase [Aliagarivorans taiwanensis]
MLVLEKKTQHDSVFTLKDRLYRFLWLSVKFCFFKFSPVPLFRYRCWVLNVMGASVHKLARIYPSADIWLPANLEVEANATIGPGVRVYNQGFITIRERAIVSQNVSLCASTHNYNDSLHPLVLSPVVIGKEAWICAEAFVGPGVNIGEGAVVGARSAVFKNLDAWLVYGGNPAKPIKSRDRGNAL